MKEKFKKLSFKERTLNLPRINSSQVLNYKNQIIFDTNFLFVPFEFNIDLILELERLIGKNYSFFIYEGTLSELENIERKKDKNKKFLPLIITMLNKYDFKIIKSNQVYVDDQILSDDLLVNILVATNDKELRKKLWSIPRKVLFMRQKSYLEIK